MSSSWSEELKLFNLLSGSPRIDDGEISLRQIRYRDQQEWNELRQANATWLNPWEGTRPHIPVGTGHLKEIPSFYGMVRNYKREAKAKRNISLGIWLTKPHLNCKKFDGKPELVGQITLGGIVFGALHGAHIGYWIDEKHASNGYVTRSVKALTQYAFNELALHRIEINIRPENESSLKVAKKAGYLYEGPRPQFLHIDGEWRDHLVFVAINPRIL